MKISTRSATFLALVSALALTACASSESTSTPAARIVASAPKVIVVAGWENGADSGDAPGEYQDWVEREHLDEVVPVRGVPDAILRRNKEGVYGLVLRHGATDLMALALDPHFDLHHSYWIFTGISGVDPSVASVGSVAWARWVVDGDALREIDDRDIPKGWPYGLYAIGADKPDTLPSDANHYGSVTDMDELSKAYPLNAGLAQWAYAISRTASLSDDPEIARRRAAWKGFPNAQRPPFVLMGETLGALRYWHGQSRNRWAERWVSLWTHGKGVFVMTNEESQTNQIEMRLLADRGYLDARRIMVLRSGSNFDMPPPGKNAAKSMGDEGPGQTVAFDNNERAGAPVIAALLAHWADYEDHIPSSE
ncbi:purine nucleoside transporter [Acetobacter nitrogenifigens DSM 23921 = NBRC 105050]|uniref:Purine nucleoside permease n=1 Tax=Acetobacter nitrogenifigens DSM 23921 = NBRC 105050 TaxID=1120919 RepID=A0A511X9L4_9PROT|nr:purine nucleoside permease [Acetobacter nitrogenifigens]GBQ93652.1 purine nucleoside transporter [Acetobacter nitrogenifigens DSM 23921 = NBRC 105050]GEN59634.1 purine nucleoside permease [Acetobacter nitrogenifigens DSM 23921 = NBRC 105050]